jgi:hypothetical protein
VHPDDYRKMNAVVRYGYGGAEERFGFTAMAYRGKWNASDQIAQRAASSGLVDRFGAIDPSDGGESSRYSVSADYQRKFGDGVLQANAYAIKYRLNLFSNFTYFLDDPVHGDQFEQADERKVLGATASYTFPLAIGRFDTSNCGRIA